MTDVVTSSRGSWSLIVTALAELGAREIERRQRAGSVGAQTQNARRDDTPPDTPATSTAQPQPPQAVRQ